MKINNKMVDYNLIVNNYNKCKWFKIKEWGFFIID